MSERRIKLSPLRDAAYAGLHQHVERGGIPRENLPRFESWARHWSLWVSVAFLKGYPTVTGTSVMVSLPKISITLIAMT
jgi:hypothetical protein